MNDKPRIGSYELGRVYPNKLAVYNLDFDHGKRATYMPEPWAVDRGNDGLGSFATFEEAITYALKAATK